MVVGDLDPGSREVEKRKPLLDRGLDDWLDLALERGGLKIAPLDRHILVESCRLPASFAGDPADQIIVATARSRGAVLITRDAGLRDSEGLRTLW